MISKLGICITHFVVVVEYVVLCFVLEKSSSNISLKLMMGERMQKYTQMVVDKETSINFISECDPV